MSKLTDPPVSENIAPKLVAVDDQLNGWRCIVLPMAHQDDLVRDAVMSASTFYESFARHGWHDINPEHTYQGVIRGLRQRQNLLSQTKPERQGVIVTLLLLWATVMVNGFSDFRTIHKLLEGAWSVVKDGGLDIFLTRQVEK